MRRHVLLPFFALLFLVACGSADGAPEGQPEAPPAGGGGGGGDPGPGGTERLQPADLEYLGTFRLPGPSGGSNWEWGGYAMTYRPDGDPQGPADGHPGSLFGVGHDHHQQVSEIAIPTPVRSAAKNVEELPTAATLQPFQDVTGGRFGPLEIPRAGLAYLPAEGAERPARLHFCWGQHFEDERPPTHGSASPDLAAPDTQGPWHLDGFTNYVTNDYLFVVPAAFAAAHLGGRRLATGRFRDGRWGGLGPALLAYGPPTGAPPARGATVSDVAPLLLYGEHEVGNPYLGVHDEHRMNGFGEADEWSGGAWLTAGEQAAVVLVGTKATGRNWYGYANGVEYPTSGDPDDPIPPLPDWPYDARGWWSEGIAARFLFFDPADLAAVAKGERRSWEPQPYAVLDVDEHLYDPGFDHERQKRYLVGGAAFDSERGILYVVERRADEDKPLIHAFGLR